MIKKVLFIIGFIAINSVVMADQKLRMATLSYGTVNWELDTIQHYGLDKSSGIEMELVIMANLPATRLALLNGGADVAVADWMWVSSQRAEGRNYSFIPYSSSVGGLMVNPKSNIKSLKDLEGKKVGVAGGALSKGWLLLQAAAPKYQLDLEKVETTYGAPPLLNKELVSGRLDAVITYWHL
ncbi:MAG: ABC transporter substrate-binding protein, partial [Deltaproteobacteria bacterium]